jgi:hypothetical protein
LYRVQGHHFETEYGWPIADPNSFLGERLLYQYVDYPETRPGTVDVTDWSVVYRQPKSKEHRATALHIVDSRGWPFVALARSLEFDLSDKLARLSEWKIHQGDRAWPASEYDLLTEREDQLCVESIAGARLPLRPIWTGFLLNSLIFGSSLAVFWYIFRGYLLVTPQQTLWQRTRFSIAMLALGFATSVAIAFCCAVWSQVGVEPERYLGDGIEANGTGPTGGEIWIVQRNDAFGVTRFESRYYVEPNGSFMLTMLPAGPLVPMWADNQIELGSEDHALIFYATGWPWRTLQCRFDLSMYRVERSLSTGFRLAARPLVQNGSGRFNVPAIPYAPIWYGFLGNSVVYGIVIAMFFAAPFTLRRWRRIKRGLCAKCAYPVGTSDVCTECGAAISSGRRSARK